MSEVVAETSSLIIPITVALIVAVLGPWVIEYWKWRNEPKRRILKEKEARYYNLLTKLGGFIGSFNPEKAADFCEHYRAAWLYVPDEIIIAINEFYDAVGAHYNPESDADEKISYMVWRMRKDFYGPTILKPSDFHIIMPRNSNHDA